MNHKKNIIKTNGKIISILPGTMFRVKLSNGHIVLGHISGKLRKHFIKLTIGDKVKIEITPQDLEKGRIIYRLNPKNFKRNIRFRN
jgi:translation initiation factor IF-1